jgi:hypothetical protein
VPPAGGGSGGGGWGGYGDVTLYSGFNFDGQAFRSTEAVVSLEEKGFNDRARSIDVRRGAWQVCSDAYFRNNCEVFRVGRYQLSGGLGGQVSSIRPVSDDHPGGVWFPQPPAGGRGVQLFAENNLRGPSVVIDDRSEDLAMIGFAGRASSMLVFDGYWEACEGPRFGGRCTIYGPGEHRTLSMWSNRIGSIRRTR